MKLDPGIHIGTHLICFSKPRCDTKLEGQERQGEEGQVGTRKEFFYIFFNHFANVYERFEIYQK
jgi:hypothetical protein